MLALAWGRRQSQEVKVHRPELCYTSQGFQILSKQTGMLELATREIPVTRMVARRRLREEPVTYWIRLGDRFSSGPFDTRLTLIKEGLLGNVPDGILVRVSTIVRGTPEEEFRLQQRFLGDLLTHMDDTGRELMLGPRATAAHKPGALARLG
jgi:EpsI family protein